MAVHVVTALMDEYQRARSDQAYVSLLRGCLGSAARFGQLTFEDWDALNRWAERVLSGELPQGPETEHELKMTILAMLPSYIRKMVDLGCPATYEEWMAAERRAWETKKEQESESVVCM